MGTVLTNAPLEEKSAIGQSSNVLFDVHCDTRDNAARQEHSIVL